MGIGKLVSKAVAKRKAMKPAAKQPAALGIKSRGVMGGIKSAAGNIAKPVKPARPAGRSSMGKPPVRSIAKPVRSIAKRPAGRGVR